MSVKIIIVLLLSSYLLLILLFSFSIRGNSDGLWDPERGHNKGQRIDGLEFYVEHLTWKKLPKAVYGGYEAAKKMRKEMGYDQRRSRSVLPGCCACMLEFRETEGILVSDNARCLLQDHRAHTLAILTHIISAH